MGIYALMMLWQAYVAIFSSGYDVLPIGIAIIQLAVVLPMWMMKDSGEELRSYAQWLIVGTIGVGFMMSGYGVIGYEDHTEKEAKAKESLLVDLGYFEEQELEGSMTERSPRWPQKLRRRTEWTRWKRSTVRKPRNS